MYEYKKLWKMEFVVFFSVAVLFTLLYIGYNMTHLEWLGYISIVNQSVSEHLKIAFYSYVILAVIEYFLVGKEYYGFWYGKFIASYAFVFLILVTYYTYVGMFGKNIIGANIALGLSSLAITQYISFRLILSKRYPMDYPYMYVIGIMLGVVIYIYWTISPPQIPLFIESIQY